MNINLSLRLIAMTLVVAIACLGMVDAVSAQDADGRAEGSRRDGFDWGWLGLLGLLGLLPRKPVEERQDHTTSRVR